MTINRTDNKPEFKNSIFKQIELALKELLAIPHPTDTSRNLTVLNSIPNLAFKKMETMSIPMGGDQTRQIDFPFVSFYRQRGIEIEKPAFSGLEFRKSNYSMDFNTTELRKLLTPIILVYNIDTWCEDLYQQNYILSYYFPLLQKGSLGPFDIMENVDPIYCPFHMINSDVEDNSDIEFNEMVEIYRNTFSLTVHAMLPPIYTRWVKTVRSVQDEIIIEERLQ